MQEGERFTILVTGQEVEKLQAVPRLQVRTDEAAITSISEALLAHADVSNMKTKIHYKF